jgi:O-acetyl-ADP-ribose deacetylase (regulator of RNase III)
VLTFTRGDLFAVGAEMIVIPVNTVGVMGAGLAKAYRDRYKDGFRYYKEACDDLALAPGDVLIYRSDKGPKLHAFAATKAHWKHPSCEEWVVENLRQLRSILLPTPGIKSVAVPALGCGLGGLDWEVIRPHFERELADCPQSIWAFEPQEIQRAVG